MSRFINLKECRIDRDRLDFGKKLRDKANYLQSHDMLAIFSELLKGKKFRDSFLSVLQESKEGKIRLFLLCEIALKAKDIARKELLKPAPPI